jgi:hypothetical protein
MNMRSLVPLALLFGLGCGADNRSSVVLVDVCAPPAPDTKAGACIYPAKCDLFLVGLPEIDVAVAPTLELPVQMNNQLASNADTSVGRVNTNDAFIEEYRIRYEGLALTAVRVPASDTVLAGGTIAPAITVMPISTVGELKKLVGGGGSITVIADVHAVGRYGDERTFETGELRIPVSVCSGCLTLGSCPPGTTLVACPQKGQTASSACL